MTFFRKPLFVHLLITVLLNSLIVISLVAAQEAEPPHWTYEGEAGPAEWGDLSEEYALCSSGQSQSPIDLHAAASQDLTDIVFNYQPSDLTIKNNGHTVQVDYAPGSTITVDGTDYELKQFHFHHPSEHAVDGVIYPLEMHLVHADADGNLAVVGVFIKEGMDDNVAFAPVFENLPTEQVDPTAIDGVSVDAAALLPADHLFYTYSGSLTTPPCSEGVHWMVLSTPITLSPAQIQQFTDIFPLDARPLQPLNGRDLSADSSADA
jgi:carbonic anhydrase